MGGRRGDSGLASPRAGARRRPTAGLTWPASALGKPAYRCNLRRDVLADPSLGVIACPWATPKPSATSCEVPSNGEVLDEVAIGVHGGELDQACVVGQVEPASRARASPATEGQRTRTLALQRQSASRGGARRRSRSAASRRRARRRLRQRLDVAPSLLPGGRNGLSLAIIRRHEAGRSLTDQGCGIDPASSRTTVSPRSTSARVVRKFVMQARRAKRPSTVAFDR